MPSAQSCVLCGNGLRSTSVTEVGTLTSTSIAEVGSQHNYFHYGSGAPHICFHCESAGHPTHNYFHYESGLHINLHCRSARVLQFTFTSASEVGAPISTSIVEVGPAYINFQCRSAKPSIHPHFRYGSKSCPLAHLHFPTPEATSPPAQPIYTCKTFWQPFLPRLAYLHDLPGKRLGLLLAQ